MWRDYLLLNWNSCPAYAPLRTATFSAFKKLTVISPTHIHTSKAWSWSSSCHIPNMVALSLPRWHRNQASYQGKDQWHWDTKTRNGQHRNNIDVQTPNVAFTLLSTTCSKAEIIIGDFNSHHYLWATSTHAQMEKLSNKLQLFHDAKLPKSFISRHWQKGYNPDICFASENIAPNCHKLVCTPIPHSQHRPIGVKISSLVNSTTIRFRRRFNFKKANWLTYSGGPRQGNWKPRLPRHRSMPFTSTTRRLCEHWMWSGMVWPSLTLHTRSTLVSP